MDHLRGVFSFYKKTYRNAFNKANNIADKVSQERYDRLTRKIVLTNIMVTVLYQHNGVCKGDHYVSGNKRNL